MEMGAWHERGGWTSTMRMDLFVKFIEFSPWKTESAARDWDLPGSGSLQLLSPHKWLICPHHQTKPHLGSNSHADQWQEVQRGL